jgi:hypothetical protein
MALIVDAVVAIRACEIYLLKNESAADFVVLLTPMASRQRMISCSSAMMRSQSSNSDKADIS